MHEPDNEIIKRLTETLETIVPLAFGDAYRLSPVAPTRSYRRFSFVFRYWMADVEGNQRPLFVKIPLPPEIRTLHEAIHFERVKSEIKVEYETLRSIARVITSAQHPGLFAVQPGAYILEFNAIVMEEINLTMMKSYLWNWRLLFGKPKEWEKFEGLLKLAGEWLKIIHHRFHKERFATLMDLSMEEWLDRKLEVMENILGYRLVEERRLLFQAFNLIKTVKIPVSSLHHDFHLGNIFVTSDGRVGALDPNWVENGLIFEDLASVLIDPLTRKAQVLSHGLLFRFSLKERYEKAILKGYFGEGFVQPCTLNFFCAIAVLEKWRANEELIKKIKLKMLALIVAMISKPTRIYFSRLVRTYLQRELDLAAHR